MNNLAEPLKLSEFKNQIHIDYSFTYGKRENGSVSNQIELCVWSKVWENNFLSLTKPNGEVVVSGGLP